MSEFSRARDKGKRLVVQEEIAEYKVKKSRRPTKAQGLIFTYDNKNQMMRG